MSYAQLSRLMDEGIPENIPLVPFAGKIGRSLLEDKKLFSTRCRLDVCSDRNNNCIECPDIERCLFLWDTLC